MEKEYNLLTRKLLGEGWTAENHPNYVKIPSGSRTQEGMPLDNYYGGFEYVRGHLEKMAFEAPCGIHLLGGNLIDNMACMGVEWCAENENPVIICPYGDAGAACEKRHPLLKKLNVNGGKCALIFCSCYPARGSYDYEKSLEKMERLKLVRKNELWDEFIKATGGHVCRNHAKYDEKTETWLYAYDPKTCVKSCRESYCPVLGRELQKKRANIYYDLYLDYEEGEGLLREKKSMVRKGIHVKKFIKFSKKIGCKTRHITLQYS